MAVTRSTAARNGALDSFETTVGTSAKLLFRTGTPPTNVAASSTGTVVATLNLPSDWMSAASGGTKAKLGTWEDTLADAAGTIGHYEITSSGGTVHERGTVTATGGGGDMTVDNTVVAINQDVIVTGYTQTAGNAGS